MQHENEEYFRAEKSKEFHSKPYSHFSALISFQSGMHPLRALTWLQDSCATIVFEIFSHFCEPWKISGEHHDDTLVMESVIIISSMHTSSHVWNHYFHILHPNRRRLIVLQTTTSQLQGQLFLCKVMIYADVLRGCDWK